MARARTLVLVLVLGDQLTARSAAFDGFDRAADAVWMAEVREEAEHVWCHKLRIAAFLSAMRHFRDELVRRGVRVAYTEMPADRARDRGATLTEILAQDVRRLAPDRLVVVHPGDHRVLTALVETAARLAIELEVRPDRHFYASLEELEAYADAHPGLLLEAFYEHMRRRHAILVDDRGRPRGGRWSYDVENRRPLSRDRAALVPAPRRFPPDRTTRAVIELVARRFADHPGRLDRFALPITRRQALAALADFLDHRLADFGPYEDAMWDDRPFLFHSRLSVPLNLKLLDPRECIDGALARCRARRAPLQSVEAFVRQILGWRELVRGIYWRFMPGYLERNALRCPDRDVPAAFWDGETDMRCVHHAMQTVLAEGYAHHIQRLMVLGNLALLLGVHPRRFHAWHMAMYVDAIDWASLPNALGMSQYADGGIVGTKPYAASGSYIRRMSNYCTGCRYDPAQTVAARACPFNALYWDFLARHRERFEANARMNLAMHGLARKPAGELLQIRTRARQLRRALERGERI